MQLHAKSIVVALNNNHIAVVVVFRRCCGLLRYWEPRRLNQGTCRAVGNNAYLSGLLPLIVAGSGW